MGGDPSEEITANVPRSVDEFLALREAIGDTPQGGAVLFVFALLARTFDPELGKQLTVLACSEAIVTAAQPNSPYAFRGYEVLRARRELIERVDSRPHLPRSYLAGTTVEDGYAHPLDSATVRFRPQDRHVGSIADGDYKVFVHSSGAASARPVRLRRNKHGIWKADEFSSLVVDVNAPRDPGPGPADVL